MMDPIDPYDTLCQRIAAAATRFRRDPDDVRLLAVSKRQSVAAIRRVAALGQRRFGENYLQEAQAKITELASLELEWHYIGQLQSNKTRLVATLFDWIHSVDRLKIAQRLNDQRPENAAPLNILIEVNTSGEAGKGGISADEIPDFIDHLSAFERLRLRGLMCLPAPKPDFESQRTVFRELRELLTKFDRPNLSVLSMGTSNDFEAAIAEGATIVRIGTALFGQRK